MHRYRDAIVAPELSDSTAFKRIIISAAVLFRYADESKYASHRFHQSLAQVHISGIPFLPGTSALLETYLRGLLAAEGYVSSTA